jgi:hypothetical protein
MKQISLLLCLVLALVACSPDEKLDKPQGVLTDTQTKTLEKAKAVEETLKKAEEERRKTLEAAEQ